MRLFWKLFCCMVAMTALACSIGGFLLIDGQFRAGLSAQADLAVTEHLILRRMLLREMQFSHSTSQEDLARLADEAAASLGHSEDSFRLSNEAGAALAGDALPAQSRLTGALSREQMGWEVLRDGDRIYLHAASPLTTEDGVVYLDTWREVGDLLSARQAQYHVFFYLLLGLILASALAAAAVSAWITRPLGRLSEAARQMAAGELSRRVEVRGGDEIGQLAQDFNQMAQQLERHVGELTDTARRQEEFLHAFAHETKTPLTSIIGYAELMLSRPAQPQLVQESAACIFREGRRLEGLSRKLLDLFVLEKTGVSLHRTEMVPFLERVADVLRPALEEAGIALAVQAAPGTAEIEPDLMESVCLNLLDNARKALDAGGRILLEGTPAEGGYCIHVIDNGRGIAPEDLKRITEPFYMADKSRSRAQGGAGLGLTVCQKIVELHGGTLHFASTLGQGTRVSVFLKGGEGS